MEKYVTTQTGKVITEEALKSIFDMFVAPRGDQIDYDAWKSDRIQNGFIRRIEE